MAIVDPKSEAGQQMIRNSAFEKPITQGDPPPPETCLKCGRFTDDIVHDVRGHQGTGCWVVHPFVGAAEKLLLQRALHEASMVMKAGQKGARLSDAQAAWNVAIDAAKKQIEQMWLPVTTTGHPIQPELDKFDRYFRNDYEAQARSDHERAVAELNALEARPDAGLVEHVGPFLSCPHPKCTPFAQSSSK